MVEGTATSFETSAVLLPVAGMLRSYFAVEPPDDEAAVRDKVAGRLLALGEADPDVLSPLLSLLDVPVPDASWARREPRERRALTIDAVKRLFRRASDEQPLLLVCEDLHWIDGETQAVLDALVDCVPTARFILLATFRPQYEHEWGRKRWFRPLRITPLGPEHATALLERLLGRDSGLRSLERLLIERTGGNPFFLEECVRSLVESATLEGGPTGTGSRGRSSGSRSRRPCRPCSPPASTGWTSQTSGCCRRRRSSGTTCRTRSSRRSRTSRRTRRGAGWPASRPPGSSTRLGCSPICSSPSSMR